MRYESAYPGIDLVYYGQKRGLEYDFVVAPGADPSAISLRFTSADSARVEADGSLALGVGERGLRWKAPYAYQTIDGRRVAVASAYRLAADNSTIGFSVGAYDRAPRSSSTRCSTTRRSWAAWTPIRDGTSRWTT